MLQRSQSYIATVPERDELSVKLRRFLPEMVVYRMARARNIGLQRLVYRLSDATPNPAVACRAPSLRSARNKEMIMTAKKDPKKVTWPCWAGA